MIRRPEYAKRTSHWDGLPSGLLDALFLSLTDNVLSPRDAVTISRTYHDEVTLVDVSTSLPRSKDEPAYLRPAPPYVRSHVDCEYNLGSYLPLLDLIYGPV